MSLVEWSLHPLPVTVDSSRNCNRLLNRPKLEGSYPDPEDPSMRDPLTSESSSRVGERRLRGQGGRLEDKPLGRTFVWLRCCFIGEEDEVGWRDRVNWHETQSHYVTSRDGHDVGT